MRIPEPASIEFYGKYLSGEDFCNFYVSATCFGAWGKTQEEEVWEISGRALHKANKERFSCAFGGFESIGRLYIEGECLR